MSRIPSLLIFGMLLVTLTATPSTAQRGMGGPGGFGGPGMDRGQMEQMRARAEAMQTPDVEWLWATMSFDMELTDEQLSQVKAVLKSAWTQKRTYLADAEKRDADWKAMVEEMREIEKLVDTQIRNTLTDDQQKQLKDLKKNREKRMEAMRPGR